jgi:predicted ester cyclase
MDRCDAAAAYSRYFDNLNAGNLHEALEFYGDHVLLNGSQLTREELFEAGIAMPHALAPDTTRVLEALAIDGDVLAVRLLKTGTAVREYMGIPPIGRPVSYREHCFYHMTDGKCCEVWSGIELGAILTAVGQTPKAS